MHLGNVILIYITMNSETRVIKLKSYGDSWYLETALGFNFLQVLNLQHTSDLIGLYSNLSRLSLKARKCVTRTIRLKQRSVMVI